jgi:hypothetical protein
MTKYKIEGGLDFFSELYKSLDIEDKENEENLCLITNLPLVDKYFKMDCGHKFNYIPLFLDTKNHKQKFNGMEGSSSRLSNNEIRCPYCRKKHNGVLPYYEELGLPKIEGVNNINPNYKQHNYGSNYKQCQFLTPNPNFNPNGGNVFETIAGNNGNCKYYLCFHMGSTINFQHGQQTGDDNYGDDKYYCWTHKKQMIKKYKTEIANKAKEEAKQAKILAKEEAKKQKEEAKQKAKDEKKQKKTIVADSENLVISNNVFDSSANVVIEGCLEILKNGTNKGTHCGCVIYNNNKCKRHYNLEQKKLNNDFTKNFESGHYT